MRDHFDWFRVPPSRRGDRPRARLVRRTTSWTALLIVAVAFAAQAQVPADSLARRQQRTVDSLAQVVRGMQARVDSLLQVSALSPPAASQVAAPARSSGAYMNASFVGLTDFAWSSARDLSALQLGDHDPHVRGFSIPNEELALDGTVDPYFKAFANIVYRLDAKGETGVELEETYFLTSSLPGNLQLKGGQFFMEFGRQNPQHPHSWAFGDQPLVLTRMFGPDGLRSQGARLSWLAPTSWYTEAMVTVANSAGGTTSSFRSDESTEIHGGQAVERDVGGPKDLLFVPRVATSFEVTGNETLVLGVSGAFGPNNSGTDARTAIYGADLYWKWKSATAHQGFPFVSLQGEALTRRYGADARVSAENPSVTLPRETLRDRGMYAQVLWGVRPMLVLGVRGEFANGDDAAVAATLREGRYRFSPNVTVYPTEFSKFRFQYNYDHRAGSGGDHTFLIQFEFLLGAHAAHKF